MLLLFLLSALIPLTLSTPLESNKRQSVGCDVEDYTPPSHFTLATVDTTAPDTTATYIALAWNASTSTYYLLPDPTLTPSTATIFEYNSTAGSLLTTLTDGTVITNNPPVTKQLFTLSANAPARGGLFPNMATCGNTTTDYLSVNNPSFASLLAPWEVCGTEGGGVIFIFYGDQSVECKEVGVAILPAPS